MLTEGTGQRLLKPRKLFGSQIELLLSATGGSPGLVKLGKIFQHREAQTLAFFWVKLESMNVFKMDS